MQRCRLLSAGAVRAPIMHPSPANINMAQVSVINSKLLFIKDKTLSAMLKLSASAHLVGRLSTDVLPGVAYLKAAARAPVIAVSQ